MTETQAEDRESQGDGTSPLGALRAALAGHYAIERELGRGGMALVFLARDLRHDRPVAIKVLRPDVFHTLGSERFLREIRVASNLNHPHILPLHDSGQVGGMLYYVMPYAEGESLRDRLAREKQLPVEEALRITRDVAGALAYAHAHGVVHRDVKPENILLAGGEAVVSDFGIARAVSRVADEQLTGVGIAIGTPAYMSPEQAVGEGTVDGRSDVYSLACVLYEMLVGHPPFYGTTAQEILVRHTMDPIPPMTAARAAIPSQVERAIARALSKAPADRFATAAQFAAALTAGEAVASPRPLRRRVTLGAIGLAGMAALAAGLLFVVQHHRGSRSGGSVNARVVVVLPFRVSGADPALGYLREGMIDLLAAKLTGDGGPRAVDPRTVLSVWRRRTAPDQTDLPQDASLQLARGLGAGRVLLGAVVGTPSRLVLNASLLSTSGPPVESSVQGPADSLLTLVDRLVAQLLAMGAGETPQRLALATSTSLPALRRYLDGQAAYRRGRYQDAIQFFDQALAEDSTFALAALGLRSAAGWVGGPDVARGVRLAWSLRGRLSGRDRKILNGLAGPRYPAPSTERDVLAAWETAVAAAPDQPEAWYELGDQLYHSGDMLGVDPLHTRAAAAFHRAVELDSSFAAPLAHLVELAARQRDTAQARLLAGLYFRVDSVGEVADYLRWRVGIALDDRAALASLRARMPTMNGESLRRIIVAVQLDGLPTAEADRAAAAWLPSIDNPRARWLALLRVHDLALNEGRPATALALTDSLQRVRPSSHAYLRIRVADAQYGGGDEAAAAKAVLVLAASATRPPAASADEGAERDADRCTVERWRLAHRDTSAVVGAIARLRASAPRPDRTRFETFNRSCATLLDALLDVARSGRVAGPRMRALDSLSLAGPRPIEFWDGRLYENFVYGNLVLSRLQEIEGDEAGALASARRRPYHSAGAAYLATYLAQEGRLAALRGDRAGAISAYRHYLALRSDPEQALKPEVAGVRARLARLTEKDR